MKRILLIKYGEISLKGHNRSYFTDSLIRNVRKAIAPFSGAKLTVVQSRLCVENVGDDIFGPITQALGKVFGIVRISVAMETEANMEAICQAATLSASARAQAASGAKVTFKVETIRSDKSFPLTSPQVSAAVGDHLLHALPNLKVDVKNPDFILYVEIRKLAYVYETEIECEAGLPIPTGGKGAILLSGGIDSPVASWLMSRRGMKMTALHFHSYPFTSVNAQQKAHDLAMKLSEWNAGMDLVMVNIAPVQEAIIKNTKSPYLTVLLRRQMLRIAQVLSDRFGWQALVTGESLGQVASQTVESIAATNGACSLPILRPLIGNDKNEIIRIARRLDTFDISIRPFEDCCTIFVPKHPVTRPKLELVLEQEGLVGPFSLIEEAAGAAQIYHY